MKGLAILLVFLSCPVLAAKNVNFRAETNTYYAGTVDGEYAFNMVLSKEGDVCMGSYYYLKHKKPIFLYGTCTNSAFSLQEQQRQSGYTAGVGFRERGRHNTITGSISVDTMAGVWHAYDSEKTHPFHAKKIEPKKREILTNIVGTYKIYHTSGFCCANSFAEYTKSDGSWGGMPSDIPPLDKQDQRLLSSFTFVLDKSLEIKMFSGDDLIATIPFANDSSFSVGKITRQEDEQNNTGRIFKYEGAGTFIENGVHITTTDNFNLMPYVVAPLQGQSGRFAYSVNYIPSTMEFQIFIINEYCCGDAILDLRKQ